MFGPGAYVPEGRIEGGRVATPTSFLIFDSYDIKSLSGKFDIFTGFKTAITQSFSVILWIEIEDDKVFISHHVSD